MAAAGRIGSGNPAGICEVSPFHFLPPLSDAEEIVVAHEDGFVEIPFSPDQTNKLDITLKPWARVSGQVLVGAHPATNHEVMVSNDLLNFRDIPSIQLFITGKTSKDGRFLIEGIPPGEHTISYKEILEPHVGRPLGLSHMTRLTFKPGEETKIALGGIGRPVVGKVVGAASEKMKWTYQSGTLETESPWPEQIPFREVSGREGFEIIRNNNEIRKSVRNTEEGRQAENKHREFLIKFSENGSFRVEDVPPGKYRATVIFTEPRGGPMAPRNELGVARFKVTVPEIPNGRTDEALDVGSIDFKPFPPRANRAPSAVSAP